MLKKTSQIIDKINQKIGRITAWLVLAMVILMFFNVVNRYLFDMNLIWQQELARFMHAIIFLAAAGYTLLDDKHVRVDVLYQGFSKKKQAIVNLAGTLLFLFPVCAAISYFSYNFIIGSWVIFEASPEYNGMYGVFILKSFIWVFTISLFLQGVSVICKSLVDLKG